MKSAAGVKMRCTFLAAATLLAILALTHADDVQPDQQPIEDDKAVNNREARARKRQQARSEEEEKAIAVSDPQELAKFNSFVDALYRRIGVHFRSRSDPFTVKLAKARSTKKSTKSKKSPKKGKSAKKTRSSKSKKNGKKRHPKNINLEEDEEETDETVAVEEEQEHTIEKRDVAEEDEEDIIELDEEEFDALFGDLDEESLSRVERDLAEEEEEDEEIEDEEEEALERVERDAGDEPSADDVNRKGKPSKGKKGNAKKGKKTASKGKGKKPKRGGKAKSKSGKKGKSAKGKKSAKKPAPTPRAVVSGFGSLTRFGDVSITSKKEGREIKSTFKTGPVAVRVSKSNGQGKTKTERTSRATSPGMQGTVVIDVHSNGKAKISRFSFKKPLEVAVEGSLDKSPRSVKFMEKSIVRASPIIARKMKFAARDILKDSTKKKA